MIRAAHFFALAAGLAVAGLGRDSWSDWVDRTALPTLALETSREVVDREGRLLRAYTVSDGRWRMAVDVTEVDAGYLDMLLAFEDKRFHRHSGVDPVALGRAVGQAIWNRHVVSGGSTLTMQVARLLEESGTGKLSGKIRQMRVAWALERRLDKTRILNLYLLLAPYGGNLEGLRAASHAYFGKEPKRLTPAESALLVAIPQAPERRRPDRSHDAASAGRAVVLSRMARAGILSSDQARAALSEPVPHRRRPVPALAPHLSDRVVLHDPMARRHVLTVDAKLQSAMESLAREVIVHQGEHVQVAILVADHASGEVLASVGSAAYQADHRQGFVDMTQALRSPGSILKPLIYGLAFDQGLGHPETLIDDAPMDFAGYRPRNFDHLYRGTIRMREALQLSLNLPVVQLLDAMGPARLMVALDRAGARAALPGNQPGLAIGLGGIGVSLEGMVQTYAAIARGGVALPLVHRRANRREAGNRVLSEVAAWQIGDILSGVAPPPGAPSNRLAYKTGTSYGHRDAWAIGFDGRHVIGVWMGRPDGTPVPGVFGADSAAPVLFQAFGRLKRRLEPLPPAPPSTLLVSNAELPRPLQRFRAGGRILTASSDAPTVSFPPDGAEVELLPEGLLVKVHGGRAPFTWLADGTPMATGNRSRSILLALKEQGFVTLSVIDANGRTARSRIRLREVQAASSAKAMP